MGLDFLRRGHRFEKDSFDKNAINNISAHGEWDYTVQEHQSTAFPAPDIHAHLGGALDSHFSAYVDVHLNSGAVEVSYLQFTMEKGDSYFTSRVGKISPTIVRDYGNGLMASQSTPLILTNAMLGQNPFQPGRDSFGIDVAQRYKALFLQAGVINGEDVPGQATVGNKKDFYATAQLNASQTPTGIGFYYHYGRYSLGDPAAGALLPDHYDREAVFANFTRDRFRLAGAYLYGRDRIMGLADQTIQGYYVQGDGRPAVWLTPFARFDWVKSDQTGGSTTVQLVTVGSSFRLFETEITSGRATLELSRQTQSGSHINAALISLLWIF
jgi:hypothetical protein